MTTHATRRAVLYTALTLAAIAVLSMDARAEEPKSVPVPVVNINTATEQQLQFLPSVGPELASRINDYKEACCDHAEGARAAFASADDLLKVKGIGPAKLAKILPYVVFTGATTAKEKIRSAQ